MRLPNVTGQRIGFLMEKQLNDPTYNTDSSLSPADHPLSRAVRLFILVMMGLFPTCYVIGHYDSQTKFTSLILFGSNFQARSLPEIKAMKPSVDSSMGYDGQFYAQIALDPLLDRADLRKAMDHPEYRSQRIVLPVLAFLIGFGQPTIVIGAYALLNLVFWFLLLFGLVHHLRASTIRHYLCILAIAFTTGSLESISRSLTDLPATTLGFYATMWSGSSSALLIALSILTKPSGFLFLQKFAWPLPRSVGEAGTRTLYILLALIGPILWGIYLYHIYGNAPNSNNSMGWPFQAWVQCVVLKGEALASVPFHMILRPTSAWDWKLFEFLSPLSLVFQVAYLAINIKPADAFWRMGVAFALLFICLGTATFVDEVSFCRSVLPMTVAFNLQLLSLKGRAYISCFLAGNLGLGFGAYEMLLFLVRG